MGAHSHHHAAGSIEVGRTARLVTLGLLLAIGLATVIGGVVLWPDSSKAPKVSAAAAYGAPGVTFPHGVVTAVQGACPVTTVPNGNGGTTTAPVPSANCGNISVRPDGSAAPVTVSAVPPYVLAAGLKAGDRVQLVHQPGGGGVPASYAFYNVDRHTPLLLLAIIFAVVVIAVAWWRGVMALVGLGIGAAVVLKWMLPSLLQGESGLWVALVGASAIMFVVLYSTHGVSLRTSVALLGTFVGIGISTAAATWAIQRSQLTGMSDETAATLSSFVPHLKLVDILTCGMVLAGLGVLNDVTVTQASAVWELREAGPHLSRRRIFSGAMRIGRDHIASTIYTLVFAYGGAALVTLTVLQIYGQPFGDLVSTESIAEEIVRTLAAATGLVLAVPVTTAIAAAIASPTAHDGVPIGPTSTDPVRNA
ncbi:MAG TPA: YibE/F family protein [Nocardioides sp.]|nr:YibE/F family protein [Nocardioides sp.]